MTTGDIVGIINHIMEGIIPIGLMIDEIMVATFSVIESTIAVIVMVHTAIGTSEGIKLGEITEITRIEITLGKVEGPIAIVIILCTRIIRHIKRENDVLNTQMKEIHDIARNHAWMIILQSRTLLIPVMQVDTDNT